MKYSTLWLSLLAIFSAHGSDAPPSPLDYSLQAAKSAKTERWRCAECLSDEGWFGELSLGAGYSADDGASRFHNWVPANNEQGLLGIVNTDLHYRGEGARYGRLQAEDLGLRRFKLAVEQGHYDGVRAKVGYAESPFYWNRHGTSLYRPDDQPMAAGALTAFAKESLRKKLSAGLRYTPNSPWRPYADFSYEKKEATLASYQPTTPGIGNGPGWVPKAVDGATTTLVKSGISYLGQGWLTDLGYQGSLYRHDESAFYFGPTSNPYGNERAYEPDNSFHQLTASGQYRWGSQSLTGRVLGSHATSSSHLTGFSQAPIRQAEFHGDIDTLQSEVKWVNRFNRDLTLRAGAAYRDRQDHSDRQVVIGSQRQAGDRSHGKAQLEADYRLSRAVKVTGGYHYRADEREYADRRQTDEQTLFIKSRYRPVGDWQLSGKASWSRRGGGEWQNQNSQVSPTLRQFYLADRDRVELRGDMQYALSEQLSSTLAGWWAQSDYKEPNIGRSAGGDRGLDLTLNLQLDEQLNAHLFGNQQWLTSRQHHANSQAPDWAPYATEVRDEVTTVGVGFTQKQAFAETFSQNLTLGLDYSLAYGRGHTDASLGYDYPTLTSKQHRLAGYALYPLNEQQSLRWDMRYEFYQDVDYLYAGEELSMGHINQDYRGYFTAISWRYAF
ncbi:MtrB/PioB family decaheme-associated outer membrane protein [Aeromonas cavernicola]|uniref:MtrB/PioB family decaheme-associated outer membrane protein n=1 Tax=Aeromonas cavernicola TaxID=1006623 RepID=A0A2H9U0I0_9GAMM|nr:MtrB/PioB family decaheme-associated outer membrane protein [Aeromonas cavernicola]PJG57552.1 hypothetical protein CUC53_17365 [Aeromonas cavernicola]